MAILTATQSPSAIDELTTTTAVFRLEVPAGEVVADHVHPQHELCWAARGTYRMEVLGRVWHLSPAVALWVPAGVPHAFATDQPLDLLHTLHAPHMTPVDWPTPRLVAVTPLVAALLEHLADPGLGGRARWRAERVLPDALLSPAAEVVATPPVQLPSDPRARAVASALLHDPADARTLADWARAVASSRRTLDRLFRDEVATSFGAWRSRVRLSAAASMLESGRGVTATARRVGYRDTGSFISAFRRVHGATPGEWAARRPR